MPHVAHSNGAVVLPSSPAGTADALHRRSSAPRTERLGTDTVYLTTGTKQSIAVWFKDRYLFVLATRADYDEPRTLLRKALEIQP